MFMELNLEELGLSGNESKIYLYLLKHGEKSTGPIIKETGISNSRVYESLNSLIKKGLVTYSVHKRGKYFQASDPSKFIENEEKKLKKIQSLIPELISLQNKEEKETNVAIYEGFEGFKTAFKKIINDCPEKETIYILGFSEVRYIAKGYISPAAIDIFEDYVYIFLWEEKPFVFMIKNKTIADSFKSYYQFLWKIAKS